jgi:hypothetical protein
VETEGSKATEKPDVATCTYIGLNLRPRKAQGKKRIGVDARKRLS